MGDIVRTMALVYVLMLCVNKISFYLPLESFSTKYAARPDAFVFRSPESSASGRLYTIKTKNRMVTNTSVVCVLVMSLFSLSIDPLYIIIEELDPISLLHFCKV